MKPFVSVIIPHYAKNDSYLRQCLQSFKNQSYAAFEVILVDNGETPSDTARNLCSEDERFTYFYIKGAGLCGGRNFGVAHAKGHCVCFCDSDDYVKEDFLLELTYLKKHFGTRISQVPCTHLMPSGKELGFNSSPNCKRYIKIFDDFALFESPLPPWGVLIDVELARANPFDSEHMWISEDALWSFRILLSERKLAIAERHLYVYRHTSDSVSHQMYTPNVLPIRAKSEQWRLAEQLRVLEEKNSSPLASRFYEYYGNNMCLYVFAFLDNKIKPVKNWKEECLSYIKAHRRRFRLFYYLKIRFVFCCPKISYAFWKRRKRRPKV